MSTQFRDESAAVTVLSGGSAGSMEFGAALPPGTSCRCTVEGTDLVQSGFIGDSLVAPGANDRVTGFATTSGGGFGTVTISTVKSTYAVISTDKFDINDISSISVKMFSQTPGSFVVQSYKFLSGSFNYSYL